MESEYPTQEFLDAQHKASVDQINSMIEEVGEDKFYDFYRTAHQIVNRKKLTNDEIKQLIKTSAKYMCLIVASAESKIKIELRKDINACETRS